MLQPLILGRAKVAPWGFIPPVLAPLVKAAESGQDLVPVIRSITRSFGFDTFMYGMCTSLRPDHESRMYVFTTLPMEWVARINGDTGDPSDGIRTGSVMDRRWAHVEPVKISTRTKARGTELGRLFNLLQRALTGAARDRLQRKSPLSVLAFTPIVKTVQTRRGVVRSLTGGLRDREQTKH